MINGADSVGGQGAKRFRWTLKVKLMGGFLVVAALVGGLAIVTSWLTSSSAGEVVAAQEQGVDPAFVATQLELDVVQVQQSFTDISATRGAPGFDDGLDEAAVNADEFRSGSALLAEMRPDLSVQLDELNDTFDQFYAQGSEMAAVYVADGPAAGNEMMEQFDGIATQMSDQVTALHDGLLAAADESLGNAVSATEDTRRLLQITSVFILVVALVMGWWLARSIAGRIDTVRRMTDKLSKGDTDVNIAFTGGGDEVEQMVESIAATTAYLQEASAVAEQIAYGDLSANFTPRGDSDTLGHAMSLMARNLRTLVGDAADVSSQIQSGSDVLAASSDESARSATEVAASIGGVADNATEQARIAGEFVQALTQITQELEATTTAVGEVSEASSGATAIAEDGQVQIDRVGHAMSEITASFRQVAENINELDGHSENVEEIVDLIRSIAEQTNLLALNAAIEAARAGEMGRGFAVVASEVKALAEESARSTEQIAEIVAKMRASVGETKGAMQSGQDQVGQGNEVVATAGAAFIGLGDAVREMRDKVVGVSGATERIRGAVATIESGTGNLTMSTESNSAASEQVAAASQEAAATSEEIGATAQELANGATRLSSSIRQFSLDGTLGMSEVRDFDRARAAHVAWKGRLRSFLFGSGSEIDEATVRSPKLCQLGKWIYGIALVEHSELSEIEELEQVHSVLHNRIGDAVKARVSGDDVTAHAIADEVEELSVSVVGLLDALQRRVI